MEHPELSFESDALMESHFDMFHRMYVSVNLNEFGEHPPSYVVPLRLGLIEKATENKTLASVMVYRCKQGDTFCCPFPKCFDDEIGNAKKFENASDFADHVSDHLKNFNGKPDDLRCCSHNEKNFFCNATPFPLHPISSSSSGAPDTFGSGSQDDGELGWVTVAEKKRLDAEEGEENSEDFSSSVSFDDRTLHLLGRLTTTNGGNENRHARPGGARRDVSQRALGGVGLAVVDDSDKSDRDIPIASSEPDIELFDASGAPSKRSWSEVQHSPSKNNPASSVKRVRVTSQHRVSSIHRSSDDLGMLPEMKPSASVAVDLPPSSSNATFHRPSSPDGLQYGGGSEDTLVEFQVDKTFVVDDDPVMTRLVRQTFWTPNEHFLVDEALSPRNIILNPSYDLLICIQCGVGIISRGLNAHVRSHTEEIEPLSDSALHGLIVRKNLKPDDEVLRWLPPFVPEPIEGMKHFKGLHCKNCSTASISQSSMVAHIRESHSTLSDTSSLGYHVGPVHVVVDATNIRKVIRSYHSRNLLHYKPDKSRKSQIDDYIGTLCNFDTYHPNERVQDINGQSLGRFALMVKWHKQLEGVDFYSLRELTARPAANDPYAGTWDVCLKSFEKIHRRVLLEMSENDKRVLRFLTS